MLFNAIQLALDMVEPATGVGHAEADEAGILVTVRLAGHDEQVTVPLAEGDLTGPRLLVTVVPSGAAMPSPEPPTADGPRKAA